MSGISRSNVQIRYFKLKDGSFHPLSESARTRVQLLEAVRQNRTAAVTGKSFNQCHQSRVHVPDGTDQPDQQGRHVTNSRLACLYSLNIHQSDAPSTLSEWTTVVQSLLSYHDLLRNGKGR